MSSPERKKEKRKAKRLMYEEFGLCTRCGAERDKEHLKQCATCRGLMKKATLKNYRKLRQSVFDHYGNSCECCGENEPAFLAIDHGPGAPSRNAHPDQEFNLTKWVVDNGFPEGFRILCHNCNMAVRWGRTCPHQIKAFCASPGSRPAPPEIWDML